METIEIKGTIDKLYCQYPGFSAGVLSNGKTDAIRFRAKCQVNEGDRVIFRGQWIVDPKYGRQLDVENFQFDLALDVSGLASYLAKNPRLKGIGPKKAQKIADAFGEDFERAIKEQPEEIAKVARLKSDELITLVDVWEEARIFNTVGAWMASFGLTFYQITSLIKKFGNGIKSILEQNPYILIKEIAGFGFRRVDDIALKLKIPKTHPERISAGIVYVVRDALDNGGHTCMERRDVVEAANTILIIDSLDSRDRIETALDELIKAGELVEIAGEGSLLIATKQSVEAEKYLIHKLRSIQNIPNDYGCDIEQLIEDIDFGLNPAQEHATLTAFNSRISVISGGAGVGKTYTIQAIVAIAEELDLTIELAAPTGKAAKRIEQVVGCSARTIHRLLEYHPQWGFQRNDENMLTADLVIIDEVSMMDVYLAKALFEAIDLHDTAVVLVGDHNQLPPVGPGNLLRDIITRKLVPTTILDQVVRQAGILKENSSAVLRGEIHPTANGNPGIVRPWYVLSKLTEPEQVMEVLLHLFDSRLEQLGFDLIKDIQVIVPQRKGLIGMTALNISVQKLLQKKLYSVEVEPTPANRRPKLYAGDKVIQTRNDYSLGVMNGEMGVVQKVDKDGTIHVAFDNGEIVELESGSESRFNISLAYALTIHRVQGSEFPCVISIIHKSHSYMHDRCLLYTAVTRAQKCSIILGDNWGIRNCAQKVRSTARNTLLSQDILM